MATSNSGAFAVSDGATELDSQFSVERLVDGFAVIVESRSGSDGSPPKRNSQYKEGLELLLARLASLDAQLASAFLDGKPHWDQPLAEKELVLEHTYPVALAKVPSIPDFRGDVMRAQVHTGQQPGAKGGNNTKRIQLRVQVPTFAGSPTDLGRYLAGIETELWSRGTRVPLVIIQPCSGREPKRHYRETIEKPVSLDVISQHVPENDLEAFRGLHPEGTAAAWGVVPGNNRRNPNAWGRISQGDIALFTGSNRAFTRATVTHKLTSRSLATELWGTDGNGQTWELMYFLTDLVREDIRYPELRAMLGLSLGYPFRGFDVLSEEQSARGIEAILEDGELPPGLTTPGNFATAAKPPPPGAPTDKSTQTQSRTEQAFLRANLFGGASIGSCALCGRELPVALLVAAHIKQRARCSEEERLDADNVVIPLCLFGCDALFERGYVCIRDGLIEVTPSTKLPDDLGIVLQKLDGKTCSAWTDSNAVYFEWHRRFRFLSNRRSIKLE